MNVFRRTNGHLSWCITFAHVVNLYRKREFDFGTVKPDWAPYVAYYWQFQGGTSLFSLCELMLVMSVSLPLFDLCVCI